MKREEKDQIINALTEKLESYNSFYIADTSHLTVEATSKLRRMCFNKGISMQVAKNTLIRKAMEKSANSYDELYEVLKGTSAIMFSESQKAPAAVIKEFRKSGERPVLKAAYIDTAVFIGDNQLDMLTKIKTKEELVGDIIGLLQSPAKNVISALQSSGGKLAGIVKTLSERTEK